MANGLTNDPVSRALNFALTGLTRRQQVGAQNVANVDTPGFKSSSVPFEAQLKSALSGDHFGLMVTNPAHMNPDAVDLSNVRTVTDRQTTNRNDDSNVDIEREMYQLADTTIRFDTMARVVTGRLGWLRTVIEGK